MGPQGLILLEPKSYLWRKWYAPPQLAKDRVLVGASLGLVFPAQVGLRRKEILA